MLKQMGLCMNAFVTQDKWSINNSDGNQTEQLSLFLDLKIGFDSDYDRTLHLSHQTDLMLPI